MCACITAGRLRVQWTIPKMSMLIPQKLKCLLFLDVIHLQFLDYKSRLQLFLIVRKYGQGKYECNYFPSEMCHGGRLHMPRKSEMRLHSTARIKGVMLVRKLYIKFILCAQRFARLIPVYNKRHTLACKPCTVISFICNCKLHLSY